MSRRLHIFVIGLPASGKSTLSMLLRKQEPGFAYATDLDALHEMANAYERAGAMALETTVASIHAERLLRVTRDPDGRLQFDDPEVWDEALRRGYGAVASTREMLFEFSRGSDVAYKRRFGVSNDGVYARSFGILNACTSAPTRHAVIHLQCPPVVAQERNRRRRALGHALSSDVMNASYAHDPFMQDGAVDAGDAVVAGVAARWPLLSLNSAVDSPAKLCAIARQWIARFR